VTLCCHRPSKIVSASAKQLSSTRLNSLGISISIQNNPQLNHHIAPTRIQTQTSQPFIFLNQHPNNQQTSAPPLFKKKPLKMSHHCHDEHSHTHGDSHSHDDHDHSDDITPALQFSLYQHINFDEVTALNEAEYGSGRAVVKKTWQERLAAQPEVESDVDEQLILNVPYVSFSFFGSSCFIFSDPFVLGGGLGWALGVGLLGVKGGLVDGGTLMRRIVVGCGGVWGRLMGKEGYGRGTMRVYGREI